MERLQVFSAILLAGGKGLRMRKDVPKQYILLAGKPIIMHSLESLDKIEEIHEIVVVCEDEFISIIKQMIEEYRIEKKIVYAKSGKTRQDSVYNGLCCAKNDNVIIHEAVRPFVTYECFQRLIYCNSPNAILGYSIPYTVVKGKGIITDILERSDLINVQLPQKFEKKILCESHEAAQRDGKTFTEDASMIYYYTDVKVSVVEGLSFNTKITEPVDLLIGEIIYKEYFMGRK